MAIISAIKSFFSRYRLNLSYVSLFFRLLFSLAFFPTARLVGLPGSSLQPVARGKLGEKDAACRHPSRGCHLHWRRSGRSVPARVVRGWHRLHHDRGRLRHVAADPQRAVNRRPCRLLRSAGCQVRAQPTTWHPAPQLNSHARTHAFTLNPRFILHLHPSSALRRR